MTAALIHVRGCKEFREYFWQGISCFKTTEIKFKHNPS